MRHLFVILFLFLPLATIAQLTGKVVKIADGDTFTLLTADKKQVKIRLHGIDCPESHQEFGNVAKQFLSDMIFGEQVTVLEKDRDRYGRTIALVIEPGGKVVNEELLKAGLAWHYKTYDKNPAWSAMEEQARASKIGLWGHKDAIAPWQFRKNKRSSRSK